MPTRNPAFAAWIQARLDERGVLPSQAAASMGVPPSTVDRWLEGVTPRRPSIPKIAGYFKRAEDEVLSAAGYRQPIGRQAQLEDLQAQIASIQQRMIETADQMTRTAAAMADQKALLTELLGEVRRLSRVPDDSDDTPRLLGNGDAPPAPGMPPLG